MELDFDPVRLTGGAPGVSIVATYTKQAWGGRKGDNAIYLGEEDWDVTLLVLSMSRQEFNDIEDNNDTSDWLVHDFSDHEGPHEVRVEYSIGEYFRHHYPDRDFDYEMDHKSIPEELRQERLAAEIERRQPPIKANRPVKTDGIGYDLFLHRTPANSLRKLPPLMLRGIESRGPIDTMHFTVNGHGNRIWLRGELCNNVEEADQYERETPTRWYLHGAEGDDLEEGFYTNLDEATEAIVTVLEKMERGEIIDDGTELLIYQD